MGDLLARHRCQDHIIADRQLLVGQNRCCSQDGITLGQNEAHPDMDY
jgi:hypothetical protein